MTVNGACCCHHGRMPLFEMTSDVLEPVPSTTFAAEQVLERGAGRHPLRGARLCPESRHWRGSRPGLRRNLSTPFEQLRSLDARERYLVQIWPTGDADS